MSEPTSTTSSTGAGGAGNSTLILIFGILGIVCCPILAPVAWFMGRKELAEIAAGNIAATNEGTTKAGMILGIIGTILIALWLLWVVFFGGLAMVGAAFEQ